jgi:hypothetical protein
MGFDLAAAQNRRDWRQLKNRLPVAEMPAVGLRLPCG